MFFYTPRPRAPLMIFTFLWLMLVGSLAAGEPQNHAFHVSTFDVHCDPEHQTIQITAHIFIDDLEKALREQGLQKNLFLGTEREDALANETVAKYLEQKMEFRLNAKKAKMQYLGKENSDDGAAIWCYLEIAGAQKIQQLFVKNIVLIETFDDQRNIILLTNKNEKKGSLLFDSRQTEETIQF